jgi:hypothetical protein
MVVVMCPEVETSGLKGWQRVGDGKCWVLGTGIREIWAVWPWSLGALEPWGGRYWLIGWAHVKY